MKAILLVCAGAMIGAPVAPSTPAPSASSLRAFHDLLGSEPHIAGTPGDARTIERLRDAFEAMGLEVDVHEFWPLLARPIDARLEIVQTPARPDGAPALSPPGSPGASAPLRRGVIPLSIREDNLLEDPAAAHPDLTYGWNAYSGSGDVTAEVVYASYGTEDDFKLLRERGVDCEGKIVLARYGGNFRGYKAKFAEEAGAAGLIIYTDPADAGYAKGLMYPEGGWANATCIQRGSVLTLPYVGDPLTPFEPATEHAQRLAIDAVDLPTIPVQPVGFAAAHAILSQMRGTPVPREWQGGLPFTYRLDGGPELRVRLMVKQERAVMRTANVIARLRGTEQPDLEVIVGCHHDAWGFGAADPLAGTICLLESARSIAEMARSGWRPRRTIVWAAWGAEEFGILGSTEWVESRRDVLLQHGVAYINLDMAAMGPRFGASASPSLREAIAAAAMNVPACDGQSSICEAWRRARPAPAAPAVASPRAVEEDFSATFGELGGGSDHVAFYCHVGVASCSFGGSGSEGTSYHSNYDNLAWYRKVVGESYEPALMVTRMTNRLALDLADEPLLPLEPSRAPAGWIRRIEALRPQIAAIAAKQPDLLTRLDELEEKMALQGARLSRGIGAVHERLAHESLSDAERLETNRILVALDRAWVDAGGLPGRPWFRNLFAAPDRASGYATCLLPALHEAVADGDLSALTTAIAATERVVRALDPHITALEAITWKRTPAAAD
jgi:N-acetylated-alpha-linked acidic dipeptidase